MFEIIYICAGILIISVFWWANAPVIFEIPKVMFFQWFVRILVLLFGISLLLKRKVWKINHKLLFPILIFAVWATVTSILGSDVSKSIVGNYYRGDGLITLYELIGFSFIFNYFWREKYKHILSLTFFYSSFLLSILTFFEMMTGMFGLGSAATFGNPVFLAGYLAVSLPFSFYLFKSSKNKIYLIGLIFQILAIILIAALSSIITLAVFALIYVLFFQKKKTKYVLISLLTAIVLVLIFFWFKDYYLENSRSLIAEGRLRIFTNLLRGVAKNPLLGYGWANVDYAFDVGGWPMKFNDDVYIDKAHSGMLEILVASGIPGLLIYIYVLDVFYKQLFVKYKKSKDKLWNFTLISVVLLYLFHSQTNVISIAEEMIFWLLLGVAL